METAKGGFPPFTPLVSYLLEQHNKLGCLN